MGQLTVIQNPFNPRDGRIEKAVPANTTLGDIVSEYQSEEFDIVCSVNGDIYDDLDYVVTEGDVVNIMSRIRFGGGGGGESNGKSVLRTVAQLAITIQGLVISTLAGPLAGSFYTMTRMALLNAILPPPEPNSGTNVSQSESLSDSNTYSWGESSNQVNEGFIVPVLYGTFRVTPQVVSQYRTYELNKDKLNLLFVISEGRCDAATPAVFINDRPIADFTGGAVLYNRGLINQTSLGAGFDDIVYQKSVNTVLDPDGANSGTLTVTTDGNAVEKLAVGITIPGGLYQYRDGGYHYLDLGFYVEYRPAGGGAWTPFSGMSSTYEYTTVERVQVQVGTRTVYGQDGLPEPNREVPIYEWQDQEVTKTRDFDETGFWFYSKTPDTIRARFEHSATLTPGQYEVRVTKIKHHKPLEGNTSNLNQLRFDFVEERIPEELQYPGRTMLGLTAVAQEEIYGGSPVIEVVAIRGELELYEGEWGNSTAVTGKQSSNPAWACYDLLTNPLYGAEVHPDDIVFDEFQDWADYCDSEGLEVNIYLDSEMSMYDALRLISHVGRGAVLQRGTQYGVTFDGPSSMVYLFGMGQIIEGSFEMTYLERSERANVVDVTYYDKDIDYERKILTLRSDETADSPLDQKASVNLLGCTSRQQATEHARFLMNNNQLIIRSVTFEAEVEAIHCQVGDIIGVSHDVPQYGQSGRVVSSTSTTVTLDHEITLGAGTHSIVIKHLDDTLETKTITEASGDFTTLTLASGTWAQNPAPMSSYSVGIINFETKLFRVISIQKSQDFQARISGIEYNPLVYTVTGPLPDYETPNGLPSVLNLQVSQSFARLSDGSFQGVLDVTWEGFSTEWKVQIWNESRSKAQPSWSVDTSERRFVTPALPVGDGETYRIRVTGLDGEYLETSVDFTIDKPQPVVNARYKVLDNFVFLNWDQPISELKIDYYEVWKGDDLLTAELLGTTSSTNFNTYEPETGTHIYQIMAVNVAGMKSDPVVLEVPIQSNTDYVAITGLAVDGTGTLTSTYWDGSTVIGPYVDSGATWDSVWQANYPNSYTTKTWDDWPIDRGVTTWMSALGTSGATSGTYVQTFDLGSLYPGTVKFDVKLNQTTVIGQPLAAHVSYDLEFSADNVTYYPRPDAATIQQFGVRYVRLSLTFTSNGDGAVGVRPTISLTTKQLTQSGKEDIDDLVTGTTIPLTAGFHDVQSITITPKGTSALIGVYDFNDVPNPTEFTAYLFDKDGNSVFGDFSYVVTGF